MDKRSPEDIRKSIKSLVEEAENVSVDGGEIAKSDKKPESKLDSVSLDLEIAKTGIKLINNIRYIMIYSRASR